MSNWQVLALRWGGLLAVIFAATLVFVYFADRRIRHA